MIVVWDSDKAKANLIKHGVDFADAAVALEDPNALTISDRDHGEYRYRSLAQSPSSNILLIIHAEEDESSIRIISARQAGKKEEVQYFKGDYHE